MKIDIKWIARFDNMVELKDFIDLLEKIATDNYEVGHTNGWGKGYEEGMKDGEQF